MTPREKSNGLSCSGGVDDRTCLHVRVQDARVAAVEHALAFLADYVDTGGGDFLARRFVQEAWPQLALLLHRGPNTALGSDNGDHAPAVVQRTRMAVLTALLRCMHLCQTHDPAILPLELSFTTQAPGLRRRAAS